MSRHAIRKRLFMLLFRSEFHNAEDMPEQEDLFFQQEDIEDKDIAPDLWDEEPAEEVSDLLSEEDRKEVSEKFHSIMELVPELDRQLNEKMTGWNTERIGKVELTILRLALYEIMEDDNISSAIAINEAVELAKRYGQEKSPEFNNGGLAKFA